jgi:N-acetylglucosamine kinase-like BadF-type ATPase
MILIADSGSTKTNWALLRADSAPRYFDTEGYNPYFMDSGRIAASLNAGLPADVDRGAVRAVCLYGAGCFDDKTAIVDEALRMVFAGADRHVGLDLLGSARAVLGDQPGFVAILGTGANTCLYDGARIVANIDSLGYLLGDEGSGFYIGRRLLADYIRGYMPAAVRDEFLARYGLSREAIMETVYGGPGANRYCAGFVPFLAESTTDAAYTRGLVESAFIDFFDHLVTRYPRYDSYTFNCTGSVAYAFRDILAATATRYRMTWGAVVKSPIEGLVRYHNSILSADSKTNLYAKQPS